MERQSQGTPDNGHRIFRVGTGWDISTRVGGEHGEGFVDDFEEAHRCEVERKLAHGVGLEVLHLGHDHDEQFEQRHGRFGRCE